MIKFKVVEDKFRKHPDVEIVLPRRQTDGSMAYDFYAPADYTILPLEQKMVWTDVKAEFPSTIGLVVNSRSSMGVKGLNLANNAGWIDSDYAGNPKNDGNIGICLRNNSPEAYSIKAGDRIAQGMFVARFNTDDDNPVVNERKGGFGSTDQ